MANVSKAASNFGKAVGVSGAPVFIKSDNVIDLIIHDHNEAKDMYEKYKSSTDQNDKKIICHQLIKALVQHDEVEQLLVYPLLRENAGDKGEEYYKSSLDDHQEHRNLLYQVKESNSKDDATTVDQQLATAMASVLDHVKREESQVLPLLKEHVNEDDLKRVGSSFKAHKLTAVTRPHPDAPSQGYPAAVANVIMKPFDLAKDFTE